MNKEQKFKRGNLVKGIMKDSLFGRSFDGKEEKPLPNDNYGREMIILASYDEKYGGGLTNEYEVMYPETGGTMAWVYDDEIELIDEGGEHLIEEAERKGEELHKLHTDYEWIRDNIDKNLWSDTILFLFNKVGFNSAFNSNGEFIVLYSDWECLKPIFYCLFKKDRNIMHKAIETSFQKHRVEEFKEKFNKFYDEVNR